MLPNLRAADAGPHLLEPGKEPGNPHLGVELRHAGKLAPCVPVFFADVAAAQEVDLDEVHVLRHQNQTAGEGVWAD